MKKVILLLVVVVMNTTFVMAKNSKPVEDFPHAMKEISSFLNQVIDFEELGNKESVKVIFTVNSDNEILVLDVRTKDKDFKKYIKNTLNQKSLNAGDLSPGKQYVFNVIFKK